MRIFHYCHYKVVFIELPFIQRVINVTSWFCIFIQRANDLASSYMTLIFNSAKVTFLPLCSCLSVIRIIQKVVDEF